MHSYTVQKRAVRCTQTGGKVVRVIARYADAGPHGGSLHVQHKDTAAGHGLGGNGFGRTLHGAGNGQLHPHCAAVILDELRRLPLSQAALCRDRTTQGVVGSCPGQQVVQRFFQPGCTMAVCVQIADQMLAQRHRRISFCRREAAQTKRGKVAHGFQQERRGTVPVLIQRCLPGAVGLAIKAGIVVFTGKTQGLPAHFQPGERQAVAVVEIAPPGGQRKTHRALGFGAGSVSRVLRQKINAAQNDRKTKQNDCI